MEFSMALLFGVQPSQKPPFPQAILDYINHNPQKILEVFADLPSIYGVDKVATNPYLYFQIHFESLIALCKDPINLFTENFTEEAWENMFHGKTETFPKDKYDKCLAIAINCGNHHLIPDTNERALSLALKIATLLVNSRTVLELVKHKDKIPVKSTNNARFSWHDAVFSAASRKYNQFALEIIFAELYQELIKDETLLLDSFSTACQNSDVHIVTVFLKYLPVGLLQKYPAECKRAIEGVLANGDRDSLLLLLRKDPCFTAHLTVPLIHQKLEDLSYRCENATKIEVVQFLIERWGSTMPYDFLKSVALRFALLGDRQSVEFLLAELSRRVNEEPKERIAQDRELIIAQLNLYPQNQSYFQLEMGAYALTPNTTEVVGYSVNPLLTRWQLTRSASTNPKEKTPDINPGKSPSLSK
jgi:hypothetical protein